MIAVESTPPALNLDAVAAQYKFRELQAVHVLEGGMFASPVLIRSDHGRFVLRTHRFRGTVSSFRFQAETIDFAARQGVACARVERTLGGEWCVPVPGSDVVLAAHQFAEGRCDDWIEWNARKQNGSGFLFRFGQKVAMLHDALASSRPGGDPHLRVELPPIQFGRIEEIHNVWRRDLENLRRDTHIVAPETRDQFLALDSRIEQYWESLVAQLDKWHINALTRQVVHGDLSPVNIVFGDSGEPCFIDWDCVHIGHRLYDAFGDVLNRRPDDPGVENRFSIEEVREYLEGYESKTITPISEMERRLVPAFCLARQLEDLRQRLFALPKLDSALDTTYSKLITMRVEIMDQIELN